MNISIFMLFGFRMLILSAIAQGVQWKTRITNVPKKFLKAPVNSNPHNYSLILNSPDLCRGENEEVFLLILVRSIPQNSYRRQSIRETWGAAHKVHNKRLKVAFLFGKNSPVFNKQLEQEHYKYHDILQESFQESYKTLAAKTVMAWKWAGTFCPKSTFIIVCNDEVFVDVFKTVSYLKGLVAKKQHEKFYGCWMEREGISPNRNLKHKHGVSLKDYPGKRYPAFCNGNGYLGSQQIIRKLYKMSLNTPSFMPDDAWAGVLASKLALVISNIHNEIPIAKEYKIIEHYLSLDRYVKAKMLLFPLDRKFSSCEVCVVHYLWKQITFHNKYNQTVSKSSYNPQKMVFTVSLTVNLSIMIGFYLNSKKLQILLLTFNALILIFSIWMFAE